MTLEITLPKLTFTENTVEIQNECFPFFNSSVHRSTRQSLKNAATKSPPPFLWGNPEIVYSKATKSQFNKLTFGLLLNCLGIKKTRSLWGENTPLHHTLVTRCRDEFFSTKESPAYSFAFAKCAQETKIKSKIKSTTIENIFNDCYVADMCLPVHEAVNHYSKLTGITPEFAEDLPKSFESLYEEMQRFVGCSSLQNQIKGRVYSKLRFISYSTHLDIQDLMNEVSNGVIAVYLNSRPYRSQVHTESYARSFVQTSCLRIIHAFTHYDSLCEMWSENNEGAKFVYKNASLEDVAMKTWSTHDGRLSSNTYSSAEDHMCSKLDNDGLYNAASNILDLRESFCEELD
jgi:hypothetical protein